MTDLRIYYYIPYSKSLPKLLNDQLITLAKLDFARARLLYLNIFKQFFTFKKEKKNEQPWYLEFANLNKNLVWCIEYR